MSLKNSFQKCRSSSSSKAVAQRCSVKEVFLEILQNSQKNSCARVSLLIKLQTKVGNFIQKETLAQVFHVNFAKLQRTPFLTDLMAASSSLK